MSTLARPHPKEFRDGAVAVAVAVAAARKGQAPLAQIAKDFGISEGSLVACFLVCQVVLQL